MSEQQISGVAWRFGSDIDTDVIIPGQHLNQDPSEYADHVMEPLDPDFARKIQRGDIIVAETNFGIGSSREHAAIGLKRAGIGAIVAESFGRIFYRNAINQGLPVLKCDRHLPEQIEQHDELVLDVFGGTIRNQRNGESHAVEGISEPQRSILQAGGAIEYFSSTDG